MSDEVHITPGSFAAVQVSGADQAALRLIAPLGFRSPRRAPAPVHLQSQDGPLMLQALATEAADRLNRAGHHVTLAPELRISPDGEQALELIVALRERIDELASLIGQMDGVHDVADVAAQLITGLDSPVDAAERLFRTAAHTVRRTTQGAIGHQEMAGWLERSAEQVASIVSSASAVTYTPRPTTAGNRQEAATIRSASARAAGAGPVLTAQPVGAAPASTPARRSI